MEELQQEELKKVAALEKKVAALESNLDGFFVSMRDAVNRLNVLQESLSSCISRLESNEGLTITPESVSAELDRR